MQDVQREMRSHLSRLALWSAVWVVLGVVGVALSQPPGGERLAQFWVWNAAWCLVNLAICAASVRGKPPADLRKLREFLALNLGLNCAYLGVGLSLALASPLPGVQGAGWAVSLQGLALLVLDAVLLSRLPTTLPD